MALLLPALLDRGARIDLVAPPGGARELLSPLSRRVFHPPRKVIEWRRLIRSRGPSLVIAIRGRIYAVAAASRLEGVPSIWICGYPPDLLSDDRETRAAATLFDKVLAPSNFIAKRLESFARIRAETLPCAPPPLSMSGRKLRERARAELGIARHELLLGYASRFVTHKRQSDLIELVARLASQRVPAALALIGETPDRKARALCASLLSLARELGVSSQVRMLSARQGHVAEWLAGCDLFVSPAENEGLGVSLLEALSAGVPAIVAAPGGAEEAIRSGRCGRTFRVGDIEGLSKIVAQLWQDAGLRRALGERARKAVADQFSLARAEDALWRIVSQTARGAA